MYPRCSPGRIVTRQPEDQFPKFLRRLSSPKVRPSSGNYPPVQAETGAVPADNSLECSYDQRKFPF